MNLYLIAQKENNGLDTYDSAVVVAKNEEEARKTHPGGGWTKPGEYDSGTWPRSQKMFR